MDSALAEDPRGRAWKVPGTPPPSPRAGQLCRNGRTESVNLSSLPIGRESSRATWNKGQQRPESKAMSAVPRAALAAAALRRALCLARSARAEAHARTEASTRAHPSCSALAKIHPPRLRPASWRACATRAPTTNAATETNGDDERFMRLALAQAAAAASNDEVPVGAVLVHTASGKVLSSHHNTVLAQDDPTAHAEMKCVRDGAKVLGGWRHLRDATLYVTLEPCPMCAGAVLNARLGAVVWGAPNPLIGADGSWISLMGDGGDGATCDGGGGGEETAVDDDDDGDGDGRWDDDDGDVAAGIGRAEPACKPTAVRDRLTTRPHAFRPGLEVRRRVLEAECASLMREFFRRRREENREERRAAGGVAKPS